MYSYQDRVKDLRPVASRCSNLTTVAQPYLEAADWEIKEGRHISEAVGTNSAVDMHAAVDTLAILGRRCVGCVDVSMNDCPLNGAGTLSPTEVLTLIDIDEDRI